MKHILDRPIWSALETAHADLAEGGKSARRYPVSIVPFAASADDTPESLDALENLPSQAESMILVESGPIAIPPGLAIVTEASLVQMVAERPHERLSDSRIQPLTEADAADM
ncbi:GNAT family N-acetyltransferase, partial [Rhizobium ruizarguesonis]